MKPLLRLLLAPHMPQRDPRRVARRIARVASAADERWETHRFEDFIRWDKEYAKWKRANA